MEFEGTKGEWKFTTNHIGGVDSPAETLSITAWNGDRGIIIYDTKVHNQSDIRVMKANAQLNCDAGNLIQNIDYDLPELHKRYLELLEACKDVCNADNQFKLQEARKKCASAVNKDLNK